MPSTLDAIDDALTTLSRLCYTTAHAFVPLGNGDESVGERYTRAAANWPSPRSPRGPAHEQQARILTALHNAGAALRAAGAHCGRAGHELAITIEPVEGRSAAPAHRSQAA